MTPEQEAIAEQLIDRMKHNGGMTDWREFRDEQKIESGTMLIVVRGLKELNITEPLSPDNTMVRLTETVGWTFPGFEAQRHLTHTKKAADDERDKYDRLTKRFIYKARFVPYILSFLALVVSVLAYFKKTETKPPETQSEQQATPPATNTNSLLPADTLLKTKPK